MTAIIITAVVKADTGEEVGVGWRWMEAILPTAPTATLPARAMEEVVVTTTGEACPVWP